jgi:hypothetical protein
MAYENIKIATPIFCLGPQSGTFCYISSDSITSRLIMINSAGSFIRDFTLSSKILNPLITLEYTGPKQLTALYKGLTFFTLEHSSGSSGKYAGAPGGATQCIVKRWELDPYFSTLNLKQSIVLSYNPWGMAVEHYNMNLSENCQGGIPYIEVADVSRIEPGMHVMIGPSTDFDNPGAVESAVVSYVSGTKVYLTANVGYQYVAGNKFSFFKNFYILSHESSTYGSLSKVRAQDGVVIESETSKAYYATARNTRWSQAVEGIALIYVSNMIFKRPYDYYFNWKSITLNNELNAAYYEVYDVVFDNTDIFKLMRGAVYKEDSGARTIYSWPTYNYQPDTLLPYTNSLQIYMYKTYLIGILELTTFFIQARDQFGVSLRDVNINLYRDTGDTGSFFSPLNGQAITDINGEATIGYLSGGTYTGMTLIKCRADKSSAYTGSQYVWNKINVYTNLDHANDLGVYSFANSKAGQGRLNSIITPFKSLQFERLINDFVLSVPAIYLYTRTYFTTPRAESTYFSPSYTNPKPMGLWYSSHVGNYNPIYWPQLQIAGGRQDGPPTTATWGQQPEDDDFLGYDSNNDGLFDILPVGDSLRAHYIKQVGAFRQVKDKELEVIQRTDFWIYNRGAMDTIDEGFPPFFYVGQKDILFEMFFSQLHLSKHSYFIDGIHSYDLATNARLNQFIFVEDAVPKFWSEKNPIETSIWIRLRPFAFDLDNPTFHFWVREVWSEGEQTFDTGYYEVTSLGTISNFDAGGGMIGIEFFYQPENFFHYGALVFVHLEVYDKAGEPNFIYLDYWFKIIPDYKSPYLVNLSPSREEQFVAPDTDIYFEIKDDGAGVDIDTLEIFINSRTAHPTEIVKINDKHYTVRCDLPKDLLYGKTYAVNVVVGDISPQQNYLRDSYRFYTRESDVPYFTDFDPKLCLRGMSRFYDISFTVLADELGVDKDSIRLQVSEKDVTGKSRITPIVYRIS